MRQFYKWLIENIEWVFSGAGVAVISLGIAVLVRMKRGAQRARPQEQPVSVVEGDGLRMVQTGPIKTDGAPVIIDQSQHVGADAEAIAAIMRTEDERYGKLRAERDVLRDQLAALGGDDLHDASMLEKTVDLLGRAAQDVVDGAQQLLDRAGGMFVPFVTRSVEEAMHCRIQTRYTDDRRMKGFAETLTRMVKITVGTPKERSFYRPEHWIFCDADLPIARQVRLIMHELYHIYAHRPAAKDLEVDHTDDRIIYSDQEERNADIFSLLLLKQYLATEPGDEKNRDRRMLKILRGEAGRSAGLTEEEFRKILEI